MEDKKKHKIDNVPEIYMDGTEDAVFPYSVHPVIDDRRSKADISDSSDSVSYIQTQMYGRSIPTEHCQ